MGMLEQNDDGQKPLFRVWAKRKAKSRVKPENIFDVVISIKLSSSEEWLIIEGKESVALLNAESKAGTKFWDTVKTFEGKLKSLKLIPAKGKLGFDIEPMDKPTVWNYDPDEERVYTSDFLSQNGNLGKGTSLSSLSLDSMKMSSAS